jgi:farnesyl diphosphate synthase
MKIQPKNKSKKPVRKMKKLKIFQGIVGWCIEWLQSFFLVADDIMDQSTLRRNQLCWYKVKDVQLFACNDYVILENQVYRILKRYFKKKPFYVDLFELFLETTYRTELGQLLDLRTLPPDEELNLSNFTMDSYKRIVKYKTAFYSFYLPIACGLILSGKDDENNLKKTEEICVEMGEYFQIQDDFLDCYADEKVLGKIGRDIEEKKCCWMIVNALKNCTEEQKNILKCNYGIDNKENVQRVKNVYEEIGMKKFYQEYEMNAIQSLKEKIGKIDFNQEIFLSLLSKIEKRTK